MIQKGLLMLRLLFLYDTMINFELLAQHEAAHAVMRWILWLPATEILINDKGGGICKGTGKRISVDKDVLVSLAGPAWEAGCCFTDSIDLDSPLHFQDLIEAKAVIDKCVHLRMLVDGNKMIEKSTRESLQTWLKRAGELLFRHADAVESIGASLEHKKRLSAKTVAAFLREHGKRIPRSRAAMALICITPRDSPLPDRPPVQ